MFGVIQSTGFGGMYATCVRSNHVFGFQDDSVGIPLGPALEKEGGGGEPISSECSGRTWDLKTWEKTSPVQEDRRKFGWMKDFL